MLLSLSALVRAAPLRERGRVLVKKEEGVIVLVKKEEGVIVKKDNTDYVIR
jgi:hypothetical protein